MRDGGRWGMIKNDIERVRKQEVVREREAKRGVMESARPGK